MSTLFATKTALAQLVERTNLPLHVRVAIAHIVDQVLEDGEEEETRETKRRRVFPRKDPLHSVWYIEYIVDAAERYREINDYQARVFRNKFRMTRAVFLQFVQDIETNGWLPPRRNDAFGRPSAPLELLVLAALARLGGEISFLFIPDSTNISESVLRVFFEEFCAMGSRILFPLLVRPPETEEEIAAAMEPYKVAGLVGAIGSVDCTHIFMENTPHSLKHRHTGKEKKRLK